MPRRARHYSRRLRWTGNLGIVFIDTLLLRVLFPVAAVGMAGLAAERGWGVLNLVDLPFWFGFVVSLLVLDLAIWAQHVMFHYVPILWRFHRMHHSDLDIDVTTGVRFHPVEIVISMLIKFGVIALLGPPAVAVIVFEIALNATAMFNHANFKLPQAMDRIVRLLLVTPDMHRVHHSVDKCETNSNFGFNLPWWDRLFGTYRGQPVAGHTGMMIGLEVFRSREDLRLDRMLVQPFKNADQRQSL